MQTHLAPLAIAATLATSSVFGAAPATPKEILVRHASVQVNGVDVFYREAGPKDAPAVLLLHGFGASSHMFRNMIPALAGNYRVVAPDLPGFGMTNAGTNFRYSFDTLADVIDAFTVAKGMERYAMYVFDYGAPIGWRLATRHPEKITAIVSQNGNAYEEGLSEVWAPARAARANPSSENKDKLRAFNTFDMIRWQYMEGVKDPSSVSPDGYVLASAAVERIGMDAQVDLLADYGKNVQQYPQVHAFFRKHQPPTLAIWSKNDPFFLPAGAEAFKRDNPKAQVRFLDTGHFAIETHGNEIISGTRRFLDKHIGGKQ